MIGTVGTILYLCYKQPIALYILSRQPANSYDSSMSPLLLQTISSFTLPLCPSKTTIK